VRLVIDRQLKLPRTLHLFDDNAFTICYNEKESFEKKNCAFVKLEQHLFLPQLLSNLYERKIQSVIVEGGAQTLSVFLNENLWDEARIFSSRQTFGDGIQAPQLSGRQAIEEIIEDDILRIFYPN